MSFTFPSLPAGLPKPDEPSQAQGIRMHAWMRQHIAQAKQQRISFEQWMHHALYAPGLGYYSGGSVKLAQPDTGGDFITAPELSPIFGYTVANQVIEILQACEQMNILEFGAGTGALARSILEKLAESGISANYQILEISPDLQERQRLTLNKFSDRVQWISELPHDFVGCVLANEVLDAMPVRLFQWGQDTTLYELFVTASTEKEEFHFVEQPADHHLYESVLARMPPLAGYRSEINLQAEAWIREIAHWLKQGAVLLFDYGFPQAEYYHPQRSEGTLMCHFRHHSHANPLVLPGLQDITAHIDFTAMADAALKAQLDVLGYTSQAQFLINAGILNEISPTQPEPKTLGALQTLLSEAEMGELFKVMALGKNLDMSSTLLGFGSKDRRHRL